MITIKQPKWVSETKATVKTATLLLVIPVSVLALNGLGLLMGGIMAMSVLTAVVFSISVVFASLQFGMKTLVRVRDFVAGYPAMFGFKSDVCTAGILDLTQTLVLTVLGFTLGSVTLATAFLFLGLNISCLFAILRIWKCLSSKQAMSEFQAEMSAV